MAGETILIIDDNPDVCILLGERVLPSYGYRTLTATDGQEGLWQIRAQKPDLILLDLRLPDMTGLDLLHILSSEGYDTPVILITAYGSELIAAQALRLGVRDYIIKPFTLDEIVESVERALTEHRLRRERNSLTGHLQHCTNILQALVDAGTETTRHEDTSLQLRRLLETAVRTAQALSGRIWIYEVREEAVYLHVAQDRVDQRAYMLHRRGESPQVEKALSSGKPQQWVEDDAEDPAKVGLTIPVFLAGKPIAVLEVRLSDELSQNSPDWLMLEALAAWVGVVFERSRLSERHAVMQGQVEAMGRLCPDVLFVLDAEDRITAVSSAVETMLGQPPDEVIGQDFRQWIRQVETSYGDLVQWYMGQSGSEQPTDRYSFFFRGQEGASRQAEVQVLLQREGKGPLRRYLIFHEVTTSQRLEQEVRHLRHALGEAKRSVHLGLFLTNLKGAILAANAVATKLLQRPLEDLLERPIWEVFEAAEGKNLLPEEIARAYREGWGYAEVRLPGPEEEVLGLTTLLLVSSEGVPHAIAALVRPGQSLSPDSTERSADESNLLGGSRVNSDART